MSLRGIWVIYATAEPRVLFSRRWTTVERRARNSASSNYFPIPSDGELALAVQQQCNQTTIGFQRSYIKSHATQNSPVYSLFEDQLYPVICVQKDRLIFVAIPLQDQQTERESASIACAITVLDSIIALLGESENYEEFDEQSVKYGELNQFISTTLPFGSAESITDPDSILQAHKMVKNSSNPKVKKPVWQSGAYKGAPKVSLTISEEVKAVQYDKPTVTDTWDVSGVVECKVELEGYPDILLTLTVPPDMPPLDHLVTHSCVQTSDSGPSKQDDLRNRKLRFSPPVGVAFPLAHYKCSSLSFVPVRGFYQMKGDEKVVKLLIQLKLHESMRNNFEFCVVHIPLFNRGPIEKVDNIVPATSSASLALSQDRKMIIWTIGQKFPNKGLEISLQASVHFYENIPPGFSSNINDCDLFCSGSNSYVDLFFKTTDSTITNSDIDPRSVTLFPPLKYRLLINREIYSKHYRIWNSHGDVLLTWPQLKSSS